MEIIGFLQVRNEVQSGHLKRFLETNLELFDKLFVYDDSSDDGTLELVTLAATHVISGKSRRFGSELRNKAALLKAIQDACEEGDAVLHLDADEVLYCSKNELHELVRTAFELGYDSVALEHRNLWRSHHWYRTDDHYNDLLPARIWRLSSKLSFEARDGLHLTTEPDGLLNTYVSRSFPVVHFGFASMDLILDKYVTYRSHWQQGYPLYRLINEVGLQLELLADEAGKLGSRYSSLHPIDSALRPSAITPWEWERAANSRYASYLKKKQTPRVTLVSLIYSSVEWLEFQYGQLLKLSRDLPEGDVEILFVANDATPEVLAFLVENHIPHIVSDSRKFEGEWYINTVYRAYNRGLEAAKSDYVLFVNSDMAYAKGLLSSLMALASPKKFIAARLVELGRLPSGTFGIEKDFGFRPSKFRQRDFEKYASRIRTSVVRPGGLYMPLLVNQKTFQFLGGFPEGNVLAKRLDEYIESGVAEIAEKRDNLVPGDAAFMARAASLGVDHVTSFEAIAYHFQEGEKRDAGKRGAWAPSGVAICNDSLKGINGEAVLWGRLGTELAARNIKAVGVEVGFARSAITSLLSPLLINSQFRRVFSGSAGPRVTFSNATYMLPTPGASRRIVLRQDAPSSRFHLQLQRYTLARSAHVVANDSNYVASAQGRKTEFLPLPLADTWQDMTDDHSQNPSPLKRKPKLIFVGAFNATKGWPTIRSMVHEFKNFDWVLISKYEADEHELGSDYGDNWVVLRCQTADSIKGQMAHADALVVASPYETQCLVALEALSQNTPVATTPTGILGNIGNGLHPFGFVDSDLRKAVTEVLLEKDSLRPRLFLESLNLVGPNAYDPWVRMISEQLEESFLLAFKPSFVTQFLDRLRSYVTNVARSVVRRRVMPLAVRVFRLLKELPFRKMT